MAAVLAAHLVNNDFTLVDRIKEVTGADAVTIFFGELRVSTSVSAKEEKGGGQARIRRWTRAGPFAQQREHVGRAYGVYVWFITRYEPLCDYAGQVVGSP